VAMLRSVMPAFECAGVCLAIENHDRFPSAALAEILDRLGVCLFNAFSTNLVGSHLRRISF
jgi:hypothetical protein